MPEPDASRQLTGPTAKILTNKTEELINEGIKLEEEFDNDLNKIEELEGKGAEPDKKSRAALLNKYAKLREDYYNKLAKAHNSGPGGSALASWQSFMAVLRARMETPKEQRPNFRKDVHHFFESIAEAKVNEAYATEWKGRWKEWAFGKSEKYGSGLKAKREEEEREAAPQTPSMPSGPSSRGAG